jgi:RNA-binding protein PNO1
MRRIGVPPHRLTPLKENWEKIVKTIVDHLKLQIRMNTKRKAVELRVNCPHYHILPKN